MIGIIVLIIKEALESALAEAVLSGVKRAWKWVWNPFRKKKRKIN